MSTQKNKNFAVVDFDDAIKQVEQARRERDAALRDLRESRLATLGYLHGALGLDNATLRQRIEAMREQLATILGVPL